MHVQVYDGYPVPEGGYLDPYREPTQREVSFFNDALAERDHQPLTISQASRNILAQRLRNVDDFHQLFR